MARSGRHFLQIPGPTNVPGRVLRAMDRPVIDHRGPEFAELTFELLNGLAEIFQTEDEVYIFPASGSGGWEAGLVNTMSAGDKVLIFDQGFFAGNWRQIAERLGLEVEVIEHDWRRAVPPDVLEDRLLEDTDHEIKAVLVVHSETSTGVASDISSVRGAIDRAEHPALLMVDAVSSLGCMEYRHADWHVDVTISGSQKGLMLPPGLGFNAVSEKAISAHDSAGLARSYWEWSDIRAANETGYFPYTPATNLLFGLREVFAIFREEGLENVVARHRRLAEATRRAVAGWGLDCYCLDPTEASDSLTAVLAPEGVDADELRGEILERFDMSLGSGLGKLKGKVFRIGHLGSFNELMLAGTLCGVEMGLRAAEVPYSPGGVQVALDFLAADGAG